MELRVIGTGSKGNSYVVSVENDCIILDAGIPVREVIKALGGLHRVAGCLITHEHQDHIRAARDLMKYGVDAYMTRGTARAAKLESPRLHVITKGTSFKKGSFTILPFETQHDAEEPCGFLIRHDPTGETVLYATDTYYLRFTFPNVHFWIVECNYMEEIVDDQLRDKEMAFEMKKRLMRSHMSLRHLVDALKANDLQETRVIVLIHLSDERSDEEKMIQSVKEATGIDDVFAAEAGNVYKMSLIPF